MAIGERVVETIKVTQAEIVACPSGNGGRNDDGFRRRSHGKGSVVVALVINLKSVETINGTATGS